jgi:hypothetical protein
MLPEAETARYAPAVGRSEQCAPRPAVTIIASAPQNVTRNAPIATHASPACAASPPRNTRNNRDVKAKIGIRCACAATAVTARGMSAPATKLPADGQCGLDRTRLESRGNPELVAGVRFQGIHAPSFEQPPVRQV